MKAYVAYGGGLATVWAFSAALIGVALGVALPDFASPRSVDWPAWVQAVGSVLAILAAVGVAWWQTDHTVRQREEVASQRLMALRIAAADVAQFAHDYIHSPAMFLRDPLSRPRLRVDGLHAMSFKIADEMICRFPFYELNDPAVTRVLNDMRGALSSTERIGAKILALREGDPQLEKELAHLWHVTDQAIEDLKAIGAATAQPVRPGPFDIVTFRSSIIAEAKQKQWPGSVS